MHGKTIKKAKFFINDCYLLFRYAMAQLGHCATRREVAGSVPDGVIGIFLLGSTQPLT
jgi:hypothetical protein